MLFRVKLIQCECCEIEKLSNTLQMSLFVVPVKVKEEITERGKVSRLLIRKARREDSSLFQCAASNKFGSSQRSVKLIVQASSSYTRHKVNYV